MSEFVCGCVLLCKQPLLVCAYDWLCRRVHHLIGRYVCDVIGRTVEFASSDWSLMSVLLLVAL